MTDIELLQKLREATAGEAKSYKAGEIEALRLSKEYRKRHKKLSRLLLRIDKELGRKRTTNG